MRKSAAAQTASANGAKQSFPPVIPAEPRALILGSMPGEESLRQTQYYAFPQNAFWRIMGELFDFDRTAPYPERLEALKRHHVALWDVLARCRREGSLDSSILEPEPNAIRELLSAHPSIRGILCNGGTAHRYFLRFFPDLVRRGDLAILRLPSTSPAAASIPYAGKLCRYREALELILSEPDQEK